jgi:RimJ/RimL family protein N-acetyltransferase
MDVAEIPLRLPDVLTDGDIRLDPHTLADAEAHAAGEDHEMRLRFDHPEPAVPTSLERQRLGVQSWIDARAAFGPNIVYALRDPDGRLMGGCEIRLLTADSANVSYWIYPAFRGRGHAARALRLLCAAAAQIPGLAQVEAHIDVDNLASRRVALAAGFSEDGTVDDEAWTGAISTRARFVRAPG